MARGKKKVDEEQEDLGMKTLMCWDACKDARMEDWLPESAHEFVSNMAASTATSKEWNGLAILTEAIHSFRGQMRVGPTHIGLTGTGKSPIYNKLLKACMAIEAKFGVRFVIQDATFEKIIDLMAEAQGTKADGLVHGLYDELAGLLSKLEKSAAGGEYNLDKTRLLNWYSGGAFRKETCHTGSKEVACAALTLLGFTQPFVITQMVKDEAADFRNEGFASRWVLLCSQDVSNGVVSTNVQPSMALLKLMFTELGWHFEKEGGYLDEAACAQHKADRVKVKELCDRYGLTAQFTAGLLAKKLGKVTRFAGGSKVVDIAFKMMKNVPELQELVAACGGEDPDAFLPPDAMEVVEAAVKSLRPSMPTPLSRYMNGLNLINTTDDCTSHMGSDCSVDESLERAPTIETLRVATERKRMGAAEEGDRGSSKEHGKDSAGIGQDKQKAFLASVLQSSASLIQLSDPKWSHKLKMESIKEALEQLCLGHPDHPNHNTRYGEILEFQPNKPADGARYVKPRKYFHKLISQSDIDDWQGCDEDDEAGQEARTAEENFVYSVSGLRSLDSLFSDDTKPGFCTTDTADLLSGPCYCTNKRHISMAHPSRDDANSVAETVDYSVATENSSVQSARSVPTPTPDSRKSGKSGGPAGSKWSMLQKRLGGMALDNDGPVESPFKKRRIELTSSQVNELMMD